MNWVEVNGASLRYEISGQGSQLLVLVHELGGALESWDEVLPALQDDFRILRYDQRGLGLSEKTKTMHLDGVVDDLNGLLDVIGFNEPVVLVGTALGSDFAIAFAARHPERVKRLIATSPAEGLAEDRRAGMLQRAATVIAQGMRAMVDKSLAVSYPESLRANKARFERYRGRWLANDPESFAALNTMVASMSMTGRFAKVQCEALVTSGTQDSLRTPEAVKAIAAQFSNATYKELNCGHFLAVQDPDLFIQEILPFMRSGA